VTFLLTDVESSTELWERDAAGMSRALQLHDETIGAAVAAAGGTVLKARGEGDSTFSVFGRPTEAIRAALAARRSLDALDWPDGCRLEVRQALHMGEVEERDGDYYGTAVNRAGRIRSLAIGGQILVSHAVAEVGRDHLPGDASLVELGEQHLRGLTHPERVWALVDASRPVREAIGGLCPYKGLLSFEPDDSDVFFGRESTVGVLVGRLLERRLVVVVGASGSGKSSVLRAGVVAAIQRGEAPGSELWSSAIITPGDTPLAPELDRGDATHRAVVVVDQMEELFTACRDVSLRERFVGALLDAVEQGDGHVLIACALRADFYGHCATIPRLASALSDATVLLGPMTDRELQRAIEAPAEVAGLRLEPGLVEVMLRDLAREPGSLPLLSHALLETWRRRTGRTLTLRGYHESGGVEGAIARTAEAVWNESLTEHLRPAARRIFLRLTELGEGTEDTRRRVDRSELLSGADGEATDAVLGLLADRRLVTADDNTVQVAHEALIREWPRLRGWLDDDREGLRAHRHLTHAAADWAALGRETSELYRGPRLAAVRDWLSRDDTARLNKLENEFLDASNALERSERAAEQERIKAQERANRRLRALLSATTLLLVVALLGGMVAYTQRNRARAASVSAQLDRAIAEVPVLEDRDRTLALLLASQVQRLRPDAASRGALFSALTTEPRLRFTLWGKYDNHAWLAPFPDGRRIVVLGRGGGDVFDLIARRLVGSFAVRATAAGVAVSPDARLIAAGSSDGTVTFFDTVTLRPVGAPLSVGAPVTDVKFSRDGARLAVAVGTVVGPAQVRPITVATTARLWDVATGAQSGIALDGHHAPVNVLAASPDGRLLAAGDGGGHVILHDADTGAVITDIAVGGSVFTLAFSPDGRRLAVGSALGFLAGFAAVYDVSTAAGPVPLSGHLGHGAYVGFEADSTHVVVGGARGSVQIFDGSMPGFAPVGSDIDTQHGVAQRSFASRVGLVLSGFDRAISVWDPAGNPVITRVLRDVPPFGGSYSPDGTRLVLPGKEATVDLYRASDLHLVAVLSVSGPLEPQSVAQTIVARFSPDSRMLAVGDGLGNIALFDAQSGRALGPPIPVEPRHQPISQAVFSPDGSLILTLSFADAQNGLFVVDLATRRSHALLPAAPIPATAAFRPDGTELVVNTVTSGAVIYPVSHHDIGRGRPVTSFGTQPVIVAFTSDGRLLAEGSVDGTLTFYDPTTLRQVGDAMPVAPAVIVYVVFSRDGQLALVQDLNANWYLIDVNRRARISPPIPGSAPTPVVYGVASFAPDGRTMVLPASQGTTIWDLDPSHWTSDACTLAGRDLTRDEWDRYFSAIGPYRHSCARFGT
jgi:class 3 adenylate cyclase/WD40 repeat protein